jgi:hypothetical protein
MVYLVNNNRAFQPIQFFIFLSLILIVVVALIYSWRRWVAPYSTGEFLPPKNSVCTVEPTQPLNLSVNIVDNRAYISWNATIFTDSYVVLLGKTANFQEALAIRTLITPDSDTVFVNLNPGNYYVRVQAINTCGESRFSTENGFSVTTFPAKFRICKKDNQNLCMTFDSTTPGNAVPILFEVDNDNTSQAFQDQYEFSYSDMTGVISSSINNYCLNDNLGPTESPVDFGLCPADGTAWTITFDDGRIISANNYALGAVSSIGTAVFNTDINVITNPSDSRYAWEIVATTF